MAPMLSFLSYFVLLLSLLISLHAIEGNSSSEESISSISSSPRARPRRRPLPDKVIVGYASDCNDQVVTAVRQGVNVVIWAFYHLSPNNNININININSNSNKNKNKNNTYYHRHDGAHEKGASRFGEGSDRSTLTSTSAQAQAQAQLDIACIRTMIADLDQQGYSDTVHLVSMGGWNGPHMDPFFETAEQWFHAWKSMVGDVFHGFDVDFEGNDNRKSPTNHLSVTELDRMGKVFQLAQQEGYAVTLAPAQSYLDIQSSHFSRYLNHTDPDRQWHADFSYFGQNAYAYWLAKYGDAIDLVMIQFYESYSRASMAIHTGDRITPENYLTQYVWDLSGGSQAFWVDFSTDPQVKLGAQMVPLPISKLVWGFANAWALRKDVHDNDDDEGKVVYFPPTTVQAGYNNLWDWMLEPRGMMFWNIAAEGQAGIYYARGLNQILHIREGADEKEIVGPTTTSTL